MLLFHAAVALYKYTCDASSDCTSKNGVVLRLGAITAMPDCEPNASTFHPSNIMPFKPTALLVTHKLIADFLPTHRLTGNLNVTEVPHVLPPVDKPRHAT